MEQTQDVSAVDIATKNLSSAVEVAKVNFPRIKTRCELAVAILSKIQVIENDETDALAEKYLVKARDVYNESVNERKEFTGPLDEFKSAAMEPEKTISTDDKATDSQYYRVKQLRNKYAQAKLEAANKAKAAIETKQKHDAEVNRVTIAFDKSCYDGVTNIVLGIDAKMETFFAGIQYENYPEKSQQLIKQSPALKQEQYDSFFNIPYNPTITPATFAELQAKAKLLFTYEKVNADYVARATPKLKEWTDKLPAKKKSLDDLKALAETNAAAAAELKKKQDLQAIEDARIIREKSEKEALELSNVKNETLSKQEADLNTDTFFSAQIATQTIAAPSGNIKKVATITSNEEDLVVTIAELFYKVFIHPKYSGIISRDKSGAQKIDENGRPEYEPWLEKLLDFYANNCEPTIQGIALKEQIKTVQKKDNK